MAENSIGTPILANLVADYIDIGGETSDIQLIRVAEELSENPNMQTITKHYTANKSATEIPVGFQTDITFSVDLYKNEEVGGWLRDIAEEQKLGIQADYIAVRLYQPITGKDNIFYARKFRVSPVIDSVNRVGGEIISISGSMKPVGDVVVGQFDTTTRTFSTGPEDEIV